MKFFLDNIVELCFGVVFFGLCIGCTAWLVFNMFLNSSFVDEKECYEYYQNTGYVLNACERYEKKWK